MPLDILRANQQSSCLVLAMHVQLCLDQSHSKILKIAVTPEKCELLSFCFFFAYGYTFRGVTNQCSIFKVKPKNGQKCYKIKFQRLDPQDQYIDLVLSSGCFLLHTDKPRVL